MANYKSITGRNSEKINFPKIAKLSKFHIDDYSCFDLKNDLYIGVVNYGKCLPITSYLLNNKVFLNFAKSLNKSFVVDLKNLSSLPDSIKIVVLEAVKEFENYGGFLNDKGEHVIDLKSPIVGPHFAINLLMGDRTKFSDPLLTTPKSVVDQFGGGSFRGPAANQVLATRWDMRPEENGNPLNRQFYILEDGRQIFYSNNVHENVKNAICTHKVNHTVIEYETNCGLKIKRTIYIKPQEFEDEPIALERQVVDISNSTNKARNLEIIFTGMFGSADPACQYVDVIFQTVANQSNIIYKNNIPIAIAPDYYPDYAKEFSRFFCLDKDGFDSYSYDLSDFLGSGSIEHPERISFLGNKPRTKGPSFFAVNKQINVEPKSSKTIVTSTCLVERNKDLFAAIERSMISNSYELEKIESTFNNYSSFFHVDTKNKDFNNYVNRNLPFQVLYQTFVSRAFAQTQKGYREIGFREIQDIYASMYYFIANGQKDFVKELLSNWIKNVYEFGYANHNFFYVGKEPGMCSDDQIWLIEAISTYLELTGDYNFLNQEFVMAGTTKTRSLYNTLKAIIKYSGCISVGEHGLPLLDRSDWNDCLIIDDNHIDGPTKEKLYYKQLKDKKQEFGVRFDSDLSESVMNAFLLVLAMKKIEEISLKIGDVSYNKEVHNLRIKLEKSLHENAFINGYYARVLINRKGSKYAYIGAPKDGLSLLDDFDGSLYLNSFSWSVLSGVATEDEISSMLKLCDKYLKTEDGFKLCTPHNLKLVGAKIAATEIYFQGDRENGGIFKHATMMFARAMLKGSKTVKNKVLSKQMADDARFMLEIVYPFNTYANVYVKKGNPRFCTQYVNSITHEHVGPILSGTATWLLLCLLEENNK